MEAAWSPAALCVAAAALVGAAAAGWWALQQGRAAPRPGPAARRFPFGHPAGSEHAGDVGHPEGTAHVEGPSRQRPAFAMEPWMVVALALFVAAVVVVPRLIGVTFLVLPFVLGRRRPGRRPFDRRDDPRERDDPPGHPG